MAPVFIPRAVAEAKAATVATTTTMPSFAQVVRYPQQHIPYEDNGTVFQQFDDSTAPAEESGPSTGITYCPHSINGGIHTRIGVENCIYLHGDLCDLCNYFCLDPNDEEQRKTHRTVCNLCIFLKD